MRYVCTHTIALIFAWLLILRWYLQRNCDKAPIFLLLMNRFRRRERDTKRETSIHAIRLKQTRQSDNVLLCQEKKEIIYKVYTLIRLFTMLQLLCNRSMCEHHFEERWAWWWQRRHKIVCCWIEQFFFFFFFTLFLVLHHARTHCLRVNITGRNRAAWIMNANKK